MFGELSKSTRTTQASPGASGDANECEDGAAIVTTAHRHGPVEVYASRDVGRPPGTKNVIWPMARRKVGDRTDGGGDKGRRRAALVQSRTFECWTKTACYRRRGRVTRDLLSAKQECDILRNTNY